MMKCSSTFFSLPMIQLFLVSSWSNLWSIKAILRGFELVSSLSINLYKNNIYGVNVNNYFIQCASYFLLCCICSFPFKILRVQID